MESYLNMVADYPAAYEGEPGFEFLRQVPTTWDETVVPAAAIDEFVTIARRKGTDWYMGTINNMEARQVSKRVRTVTNEDAVYGPVHL